MFLYLSLKSSSFHKAACNVVQILAARSISDDLSSGDAARFRDDEYGKSESSSARNDSAHKGEKDKEKMKEDRDEGKGEFFIATCGLIVSTLDLQKL